MNEPIQPIDAPSQDAAPKCKRCHTNKAQPSFKGLCDRCYRETRDIRVPRLPQLQDLINGGVVQTDEDWKNLALQVQPLAMAIAKGEMKATAAQAAMIKEIWARAHGRVTKSQEEEQGPSGIVVLPTLENGSQTHICTKCAEYHGTHG